MFFSLLMIIFAAAMTDKIKFLERVTPLFWRYGAKSLTMDEIAREFSISKKTLYQSYPNKEALLQEVLDYTLESIVQRVQGAKDRYSNPIEAMLNSYQNMEVLMTENSNVFVQQLSKYYDKILEKHKVTVYEKLLPVFENNVLRGQEMNFYRNDLNVKIYFKFLLQLFFSVEDSPLFSEERNSEQLLCINIVDFYLNSILTETGRQNYNELKTKYE